MAYYEISVRDPLASLLFRIGDPSPPVIPHLMRDPFGLDSRLRGNDKRGAGMTHPLVILNRKQSASDWGSSPDWIPACAGMTKGGRE